MKTLYIVRHAKSSWDNPELDDFDRPLNERGKTDAPRTAKRLKEKDIHPQLMLSSPANRAYATAKVFAAILGYAEEGVKTEKKLYHASTVTMVEILKNLSDKLDQVMIFGHNPGLTDLVNEIGKDTAIDNIPTCGVAAFKFPIDSWRELSDETGELLFFDYPKSRKD